MAKILLVEDDENFSIVLKSYLEIHKYKVTHAKNGAEGLKHFNQGIFDICILDIMMPEMDGFTLASKINEIHPQFPFLFLSAKSLKQDILKGYKLGAVDYLVKPFDSEVLLQKLEVITNRTSYAKPKESETLLHFGDFHFECSKRTLHCRSHSWKLSPKESELLKILVLEKNEVVGRDYVLHQIWNNVDYFTARSMDVYINKLRKYLKVSSNVHLENIHGKGFILRVD